MDTPSIALEVLRTGARARSEISRAQADHPDSADRAMARYGAGDDEAFALVYDQLAPRLFGYLLRQTRDAPRAEDLVQQTFLRMHRARDRFAPGSEVTPWAFAIARRLLIDSVRGNRREAAASDSNASEDRDGRSTEASADELLHARELAWRLEQELERLPEKQRAAFELVRLEGLSLSEAAQALGTTVGAVKLRAHRACVALRAALGDATTPAEGGAE